MGKEIVVGIDIGGTHITCAAIYLAESKIIDESRVSKKVDCKGTVEDIMNTWASAINETLAIIDKDDLIGIGFAIPGPFNYQTGVAKYHGNDKYEALFDVEIESLLKPKLDLAQDVDFRYINDASAFAVGVAHIGKAKGTSKSISLTLGTGLGSAFIDSGIPITDHLDVAEHGCLWHTKFEDGIADDYFSTRWFVREFEIKSGIKVRGVKELSFFATSNPKARKVFEEFGANLGHFMTPWIHRFKPEVLVLGGKISGAFSCFSSALQKVFDKNGIEVEIKVSDLKEDAALIGSGMLLKQEYWIKIQSELPIY